MTKEEFKYFYNQYFDALRNYLYYRSGNAELVTDIVQEAFIKIWEKQIELDNAKGLLYKIANDLFISSIRHQKVVDEASFELKFRLIENTVEDEGESELKQKYESALSIIPEKQRVVFLMNKMDGLTYKEIAGDLQISVKAVEKRMGLALKMLREEVLNVNGTKENVR